MVASGKRRFQRLGQFLVARGMEVLSNALVRLGSVPAAQAVSVREVAVRASVTADGGVELIARYHLTSQELTGSRPLFFDARHCPLELSRVSTKSGPAQVLWGGSDHRRPRVFTVSTTHASWEGETVELEAKWHPGGPPCLPIPSSLPTLVSRGHNGMRAEVAVDAGRATPLSTARGWFEAAIVRDAGFEGPNAIVTSRLAAAMNAPAALFQLRVSEGIAFLGTDLGRTVQACTAWQVVGEPWNPWIQTACCHPIEADGGKELPFGWQLAAIWWGAGCRVTGRHGRAVENALRMFCSLRRISACCPEKLELALRTVVELSRLHPIEGLWTRFEEHADPSRVSRLTLAIYEASKVDDAPMAVLRSAISRGWRREIRASSMLVDLRRAGVDVFSA